MSDTGQNRDKGGAENNRPSSSSLAQGSESKAGLDAWSPGIGAVPAVVERDDGQQILADVAEAHRKIWKTNSPNAEGDVVVSSPSGDRQP